MITIIDYELGNLASVANALKKLSIPYEIANSNEVLQNARAFILPGVGAAAQGMKNLKKKNMDKIIIEKVTSGTPILGICLGMQLLLSFSEEGDVQCMNIIKGPVKKFDTTLKIPQIGWNDITIQKNNPNSKKLFKNIPDKSFFYFVNSYYCEPEERSFVSAKTDYESEFCSAISKDSNYGVQFHPEKSGSVGLQVLKNFWEEVC